MRKYVVMMLVALMSAAGCHKDDVVYLPERVTVSQPVYTDIKGFYLLNEGNMGSNKATLDYYDYESGTYTRNIYGAANPDVPKEMGDVGNDLAVYGSRLWAVINCSNKVEVMNAADARRIGHVDIPNCRFIRFHDRYAYVTSYAGPVEINPDYSQLGYVAKVDTATLEVVDRCLVGYQPDGLEIAGDRIYVANSGGYRVPNYENRVSVIDLSSFEVVGEIEVDVNLEYVIGDRYGNLWISSRGDYYDKPSRLYCYDMNERRMVAQLDVAVSDMWLDGDSLYVVAGGWNNITMDYDVTNAIVDTRLRCKVSDGFITDGTEKRMQMPFTVFVNPVTKEIFVTDAGNYVNPGWLYCYSPDGVMKWRVRTGDIPAHAAFIGTFRK